MRELIITEFVSLDGVMEAPGGEPGYAHSGWVSDFFDDELGAFKLEEQLGAEVLLLGRKTYESFHGAWPERDGEMAEKINTMRKLVASTTLEGSEWENTRVISSDLEGAVRAVKEEDGDPILIAGSRSVARAMLAAGLVDQINLQVFPLVLGSGMRFYPDAEDKMPLTLKSSQTLETGVVLQQYRTL
ncbi:MAG: dihydrofolate reductase [Solirubrobacterales bacterium]|nr:dihydrofolate reductase [Solirubrobacterales bacterium]MCB8970138.1 dihydrofolate reductase [Thermoleophilales bacterium]MCO5326765.1 dihydrofolate reductase family protein [Solirubrobacterales bacterium]